MAVKYSKSESKKRIASLLLIVILFDILIPLQALALTDGPSQPEVQGFQPIGITDMVDPFSGDFSYSLPLLEVDGYPLNLVYNSGTTMDQEASWVGLGWNLNPGVINRNMRGLPDEFDGDKGDIITKEFNMKPNTTVGIQLGVGGELFGSLKVPGGSIEASAGIGFVYNNYKGFSLETTITPSLSLSDKNKPYLTAGLGIKSGQDGLTLSPSLGLSSEIFGEKSSNIPIKGGLKFNTSFNSREGLRQSSLSASSSSSILNKPVSGKTGRRIYAGLNSYTPSFDMPMKNVSLTYSIKTAAELFGLEPSFDATGYITTHSLFGENKLSQKAYGYFNLDKGIKENNYETEGVLDFNREKEVAFNLNTSALPQTSLTYDLFSVSAHGIGGTFRAFRSDIGYVSDPTVVMYGGSFSGGFEVGSTSLLKAGIDIDLGYSTSNSGSWLEHNLLRQPLHFNNANGLNNPKYESYYFKQVGELSVDTDLNHIANLQTNKAVSFNINAVDKFNYLIVPGLSDKSGSIYNIDKNYLSREKRTSRSQNMIVLNRDEAKYYGVKDYSNISYPAPGHHPGEISILKNDGSRYVFGLPAYNIMQEEASFAVGIDKTDVMATKVDRRNGYVRYENVDNSVNNRKGVNNSYNSQVTGAYAHSFLLTAILSSDYVDIDGERGPSEGDLGNYTLFEYKKLPFAFKWRTPFESYQANYNPGLKYTSLDDQANYVYGQKEIWYVEKIVSKNTIAIFHTEERKDGHGVKGKNGHLMKGESMHLLRKISLYSKPEYEADPINAIPIKEVHFEYDYSLCPNVPNNSGESEVIDAININENKGKLTLKKVYFTYGKSKRAKFSAYKFDYGQNIANNNPSYCAKCTDRWGTYKPNKIADGELNNTDFPFVTQDKESTDEYASVWNLKKIFLPSGGIIEVEYESDDYSHVQNKRASMMYSIEAVMDDEIIDILNDEEEPEKVNKILGDNHRARLISPFPLNKQREYLVIKLAKDISGATTEEEANKVFKHQYLSEMEYIHFRFKVAITNGSNYEFVSGYAEYESFSVFKDDNATDYSYAWIKLKRTPIGDINQILTVNPISKTAWSFGRLRMPSEVYNVPALDDPGYMQVYKAVANTSFLLSIIEFIQGPNISCMNKGYGKHISLKESKIRLTNPLRKQLGGGSRVKKIVISDEWQNMVSGDAQTKNYGQTFDYTTTDEKTGEVISSGVASYEPMIGSEENTWHQPLFMGDKKEKLLVPDDKEYMEYPLCESFFPTPSIGYRKVTVKNIGHENVKRHATGFTVHEFYTAKDYPTIVEHTTINAKEGRTKFDLSLTALFNNKQRSQVTAVQGFSIELNDMHGKPKSQWVYAEDASKPISGVEYKYQSLPYDKQSFRLNNIATVIYPNGEINESAEIGVEYDIAVDFRESNSESLNGGIQLNVAAVPLGPIPIPIPSGFPSITRDETKFRSATITKVISRYGILEETVAYDLGSSLATSNLAYDSETGLVMLTKTLNEFNDYIYSLNLPAHWYYEGMGGAYKNIGLEVSGVSFDNNGKASINNAQSLYFPGDEIVSDNIRGWVKDVSGNEITVINLLGEKYRPNTSGLTIKVIRSGYRNLLSNGIGHIVSYENPLHNIKANKYAKVVDASVQVYKEGWKTYCGCFENSTQFIKQSSNDYAIGLKGIWRPFKSFVFLSDRDHTFENNNTNIRKDGLYSSFTPYWNILENKWEEVQTNWTWVSEVTETSPYGEQLESRDALYRYSSALYGFNHSLTKAVAGNAMFREIGFDDFEDYNFFNCEKDHFSFKSTGAEKLENEGHTGKKSIKVEISESQIFLEKNLEECE
ncbi:MAG: hypothetical protein M0R38_09720 [Bacteroidia bacterium]|nr:hypothetical protein [Bacteroidia bacterium]